MLNKLRNAFFWYVGRKQIDPIELEQRQYFVNYLESNGRRVGSSFKLGTRLGLFANGIFFFEDQESIQIRYESKYIANGWCYIGSIESIGSQSVLRGFIKAPLIIELFSSIILFMVLLGISSLVYAPIFLGRSISVPDVLIVLIGFPMFLFFARTLIGIFPFNGITAKAQISEFLDRYNSLDWQNTGRES